MNPANGAGPASAANRAERFEDEKRRIIDSCFYKKDTDGSRASLPSLSVSLSPAALALCCVLHPTSSSLTQPPSARDLCNPYPNHRILQIGRASCRERV